MLQHARLAQLAEALPSNGRGCESESHIEYEVTMRDGRTGRSARLWSGTLCMFEACSLSELTG
jgi:hypothetical protein